jgi:flagellin-like protein
MASKGITPIISIILLLMMTIAVAGGAFFWLTRIQNQLQGGVESYQATTLTQMASRVDVLSANYDGENLTIHLQNTGNTKIPLTNTSTYPTTTWILRDENQIAKCSTTWSSTDTKCISGCGENAQLDVGQMAEVKLNLTGSCKITSAGGKLYSFTIDFSGKTTTSGSFIY